MQHLILGQQILQEWIWLLGLYQVSWTISVVTYKKCYRSLEQVRRMSFGSELVVSFAASGSVVVQLCPCFPGRCNSY